MKPRVQRVTLDEKIVDNYKRLFNLTTGQAWELLRLNTKHELTIKRQLLQFASRKGHTVNNMIQAIDTKLQMI